MAAFSPACAAEITQPDTVQAAIAERAEELCPERLVLAVAHIDAQDFPVAISTAAGGDHDCLGHDLPGFADMQIGRVEFAHVQVGAGVGVLAVVGVDAAVDAVSETEREAFDVVVRPESGGGCRLPLPVMGGGVDQVGDREFDPMALEALMSLKVLTSRAMRGLRGGASSRNSRQTAR